MTDAVAARLTSALEGRYRIERELGGGGMSRVFQASETDLGRTVVIKVVSANMLEGVSAERFTREMKLAARLQQANIVPLLNAGDANGMPYYTMPFVEGLSLRARLANGRLPLGEATHILRDVAKALAYAHAQNVVHRDIKPENVLLSSGTAMVTDFGIAKALSASRTQDGGEQPFATAAATLTSAGSSLGTPAYMAPEQALGSVVDLRADLYAWGVMAYELLTGAHPFAGKTTAQQLVAAHIADKPTPLSSKNADIPPALALAVMRCLEKDPDQRPASANDLLVALDTASTPASRDPSPTASLTNRRLAMTAIAALVVIVATGAWMISRGDAETAENAPSVSSTQKSLAVVPFESVGGDTANAYFAEGIADELTTALSRIPGLRLAGRNSAARFKGQATSATDVGKALNVTTVLDGSVRRSGDRVRVTAELANVADGRVLWQDTFERRLEDVFAVQSDIAAAIATALQVRLSDAGGASTASRGTTNFEAYDNYLRGLQLLRRRGAAMREAEKYFDRAIELDSNFARAHAAKSLNLLIGSYFLPRRISAVLPPARVAAQRALQLDPSLAEVHIAMGQVHLESFEWAEAEAEFRRAVALNPAHAEAQYRLGFMLITAGRLRESVPYFEYARVLDPLWSTSSVYLGFAWVLSGRVDEGIAEARRGFQLDPGLESAQTLFSFSVHNANLRAESAAHAARMAVHATDMKRLGWYSYVMLKDGLPAEGLALRRRLLLVPPDTWGIQASLMISALGVGDTASALSAMERAAAGDGDLLLAMPLVLPVFDALRASPRFAAALRRFNLDVERLTSADGGRAR
jgi:serine/threonine protein kinase/tetratricopeptide (TPR) repeat protein